MKNPPVMRPLIKLFDHLLLLVQGQVTIIFVVSVCLFVCAEFFSAVFDPISIKLGHMLYVWVLLCPLEYRGCATPGGLVTPKKVVFLGVLGLKKLSRPTVLIGLSWFLVICTTHQYYNSIESFFAISILNPNYNVINDVISGFAKLVIERCGFHHWIAQRISWAEVVSVFLYLL